MIFELLQGLCHSLFGHSAHESPRAMFNPPVCGWYDTPRGFAGSYLNIIENLKEKGEDGRVIAAEMEKRTKEVFPED